MSLINISKSSAKLHSQGGYGCCQEIFIVKNNYYKILLINILKIIINNKLNKKINWEFLVSLQAGCFEIQ